MLVPSVELQRSTLLDTQKRHAYELMRSGIAQKALRRRFDETWYSDASTNTTPSESLPVVMIESGIRSENTLYVYLMRGRGVDLSGTEVNIADVEDPGTEQEEIVPMEGFTLDEANIVKSLVDELLARKSIDLPDLRNDLLDISA